MEDEEGIDVSKRNARIEWSWMKAYSRIVLDECDWERIFNVQPPDGTPQFVIQMGEDTNNEEYVVADGKETL